MAKAKEDKTTSKRRSPKGCSHATKEENGVETKEKAPESISTPPKSNKMAWKQRKYSHPRPLLQARMYFIKQEMKGEESYLLDFERWALAEGKSVVILYKLQFA